MEAFTVLEGLMHLRSENDPPKIAGNTIGSGDFHQVTDDKSKEMLRSSFI